MDMRRHCDGCGQFLPLWLDHGSSHLFVPDTPFTYEEDTIHCPKCTKKYGPPVSWQNVDQSKVVSIVDRGNDK